MKIEANGVNYSTSFSHAQIEITGCCNMKCKHCRAINEKPTSISIEKMKLFLDFATQNSNSNFNLTISGGEPFIHPQFLKIMELVRAYDINEVVITTNGSLLNIDNLSHLDKLNFKNLTIQISLDSVNSKIHDENRNYAGAFDKAIKALKMIQNFEHLTSSVRMTINKITMNEIEGMINLLMPLGVKRLGVGGVIPSGAGAVGSQHLKPQEKKEFLYNLASLAIKHNGKIELVTEDPLKCLVEHNPWMSLDVYKLENNPAVFGGCTAGIDCFNVNTDLCITPCSVFNEKILCLNDYNDVEEVVQAYVTSPLVKRLFSRQFDGKCNNCKHKRICGGCRATSNFFGGSYFASDGTCWLDD